MKTIIRIGAEESKLAPFATAMLADAFDKRRSDFKESVLVVEKAPSGQPVYIVVSPHPPEIAAGDRRVFAVFSPIESQEPVATFCDEDCAKIWARDSVSITPGYEIRPIDSTDRVTTHVGVAIVIKQQGADEVIYCRLRRSRQWALPEGQLGLGETVDAAARRIARNMLGIEISEAMIPSRVPYVNAYIEGVGHFVSLVVVAFTDADPQLTSDVYDLVQWAPAATPPEPQFMTVRTIRKVLETEPSGS